MSDYSINGKTHRILHRLLDGPATKAELAEIVRGPNQTAHAAKKRVGRLLIQLATDRLVWVADSAVTITPAGRTAYSGLGDLGAATTSVRVFGRAA